MKKLSLLMGAICDPISAQLSAQGFKFTREDGHKWDQCATSISRLHLIGILIHSEAHCARKRLVNIIAKTLSGK